MTVQTMSRAVETMPHRVHFVGVGGVGMSAIALVLAARGHEVSGSDLADSSRLRLLEQRGIRVCVGHDGVNLGDAEAVLVSTAIDNSNPEIAEAKRRGLPLLHRSIGLSAVFDSSEGLGVAGTHGKTTTSGMLALALVRAGVDPTALIGSEVAQFASNVHIGQGPQTVAEVDESDGSLVNLHPQWSIILNLDLDHMDHYGDEQSLLDTFRQYMGQIDPEGGAVIWHDDERLARLRAESHCQTWTYSGSNPKADYQMRNLVVQPDQTRFSVHLKDGTHLVDVTLRVPGEHNALNATSVVALCHLLDVDLDAVAKALGEFVGTKRRFEIKGKVGGITVVDDYAHHPTEIIATIKAARSVHPVGRVIAAFQPHRYSRTQHLWQEFAESLSEGLDEVIITDIYPAGEAPIDGINAGLIHGALTGDATHVMCPTLGDVVEHLASIAREGDLILTIGAGDIVRAGEALVERLGQR